MKNILRSSQGQITIFFATTMLVVISFIAFIINIGIFVKAKINLQNAVDAAAYSGAAVQARQLTNIAYLNWEMRNVYKEWMFKYYVLGNLNIDDVAGGASGTTDFTMRSYDLGTNKAKDNYNFPSVCLDFAQAGGVSVCTNYTVAGLPRFEPVVVSGSADETLNTMMDTLVSEKSKDCSNRSAINYAITSLWAFNVKQNEQNALQQRAPQVASNRPGAFPTAFELAVRMRNLEAQVNKAPYSGVCYETNSMNNSFCSQKIEEILSSNRSASNERVLKAFYSGFRNLGSETDTELRETFTLTEIPPRPFRSENAKDLSNLFIPSSSSARDKYYLDLKLMTVNLATFFTQFTQTTGDVNIQGVKAGTEGQCAATKTGLPIPGYPMGFVKNPNVLTYYAVKGEAKFIGLFNPFDISDNKGITLTAYAAAKPFGGRIGPMLFKVDNADSAQLKPRATSGSSKFVSSAYIAGVELSTLVDQYGNIADATKYQPGSILPLSTNNKDFWLSKPEQTVGGWISGGEIVFSVPNIIYDYPNSGEIAAPTYFSTEKISILDTGNPTGLKAGLYNAEMFNKFADLLKNRGGNVQPQDVNDAIMMVRAPTNYERNHYLIPTPETVNKDNKVDSFGVIVDKNPQPVGDQGHMIYNYHIYAPLFSDDPDSLYRSPSDVIGVLQEYLEFQDPSIKKYVQSMRATAEQINNDTSNTSHATGQNLAQGSAKMISDHIVTSDGLPTCASLVGRFTYFYLGAAASPHMNIDQTNCPDIDLVTLPDLLRTYFTDSQRELGETYYTKFVLPPGKNSNLFTAYRPGVGHDAAGNDGIFTNVLRKTSSKMWRNFYSTKFSSLNSFLLSPKDPGASYIKGNFTTFSEGNYTSNLPDISQKAIVNGLDIQKIGVELKNIYH